MKTKVDYKPEGFQNLIPYLHVNGAAKLIAFMKQAFDAQEIAVFPRPDGTVAHGSVRIGETVVELADGGEQWPAMPCAFHLYVPDIDATYQRALKAGATSLQEPADQVYGERSAAVKDLCGNNWYIATQIEVITREDIDQRIAATEKP